MPYLNKFYLDRVSNTASGRGGQLGHTSPALSWDQACRLLRFTSGQVGPDELRHALPLDWIQKFNPTPLPMIASRPSQQVQFESPSRQGRDPA